MPLTMSFNQQDHIVWGAFLHDIGKLFERGDLLDDKRDDEQWQTLYCPFKHGHATHKHVLHTDSFNDWLVKQVGSVLPTLEGIQDREQATEHWMNYAARHHKPATFYEKLVSVADRLASTEREGGTFYTSRINRKAMLEPITARVQLDDGGAQAAYRYPLSSLNFGAQARQEQFYPQIIQLERDTVKTKEELDSFYSQRPFNDLTDHYKHLGENLMNEVQSLVQHYHAQQVASEKALATTLLSLFEKYLTKVPAATNTVHPDISLFDHLKITAAIAETLYVHQQASQSLPANTPDVDLQDSKAIDDEATAFDHLPARWRLLCCDFSGIQSFIYNITSKQAANALHGRSLFVQILCDSVADYLLQQLDLYPMCKIYSSGGKFYLLIADSQEQQAKQLIDETINDWLLQAYDGDIYLARGFAKVTAWHFQAGNMGYCWKAVSQEVDRNKQQKYKAQLLKGDLFNVQSVGGDVCQVTGKELKPEQKAQLDDDIEVSKTVKQLINLGKQLKDVHYVLWDWGQCYQDRDHQPITLEALNLDIYFLRQQPDAGQLRDLTSAVLERLDDYDFTDSPNLAVGHRCRLIARWDKAKVNDDFETLAKSAKGIDRLGVLRMDVDNLGEVFARGLSKTLAYDHEQGQALGSLSRMTALSRELNYFFSGHLMQLLKSYCHTQIIYAGGDDLFIVGAWNELMEASREIEQAFKAYTCCNPSFTISGGLALVRGKYPIAKAAELAGDMEEQAKENHYHNQSKNSLAAFETVLNWRQWNTMIVIKNSLDQFCDATGSNALLSRMRELMLAVERYSELANQQHLSAEQLTQQIYWQKHRFRLVYHLSRLAKRYPEQQPLIEHLQHTLIEDETLGVLHWLKMPICWHTYENRQINQLATPKEAAHES